ncbi:unnamed protein product [Urochloa humidicola]
MGFAAIYPAPSRPGVDNDARTRAVASPADSARSSSSSFDGRASYYDGGHPPGHSLEAPPSQRRQHRAAGRLFQKLRHALPLLTLTPRCGRLPQVGTPSEIAEAAAAASSSSAAGVESRLVPKGPSFSGAPRPCRRMTGTLYGHRRGRVVLALQETPRCLPSLVVELALQTHALLRELGNPAGARIVLETDRRPPPVSSGDGGGARRTKRHLPLLDEPGWTMFCNGKKTGYAVRREANGDDLKVMETLRAVSMGAGVLPGTAAAGRGSPAPAADDEVPYMRGCFDHFVGSRDSESLYMIAPQGGGTGPELAVFFVRI